MAKKAKKQTEKQQAELREGTVIKNTGSAYNVRPDDGGDDIPCRIKGNFRIKGIRTTNPVAVGDKVLVAHAADDADYIVKVLQRRNYIIRRASNLSKESHILAANIDRAFLIATLREPTVTTTFIDRFLATAEAYAIPATLVINKTDLWDEDDYELANALKYLYTSIGYDVIFTSTISGEGIDTLQKNVSGKISLMAGNSGVGKSSLINALVPNANLRTGDISDIHHTGTHTTTFSEMIALPDKGWLIDIPGVKGFGVIDFEPTQVSHYFPEIFRISADCKYSDCIHSGEPGCAVQKALDDHFISESRYASYLSILEESKEANGSDKYRKPF